MNLLPTTNYQLPITSYQLPPSFIYTVSSTFAAGKEWLANLPSLIAACQARWGLTAHPPFAGLSYNYVAPATLPEAQRLS
jgi:hypothetical protein